jgi:ubiquinone/menaquinone biosynthesis C-methylase UbiE
MGDIGHSEEYFGEFRDFWWNQDYIDLLAKRWNLGSYSTLLDVGCGLCHWSKILCPYLKQPAKVVALDSDQKWAQGNESIRDYFRNQKADLEFIEGNAYQIPFSDDSFDIVTCQTVLIHIKDPLRALIEMKRVLKKGGLLICAEPNNIAGNLVRDSLMLEQSIEATLDRVKFNLIYEKGKKRLGQGDSSFGDFLPGYFAEVGLKEIKVYQSDKTSPIYPPYSSPEELVLLETWRRWVDNKEGPFDYQQSLEYFKAVSEEEEHMDFFHRQWRKNLEEMKLINQEINKKQYHMGGACIMYVTSGMK